MTFDRARFLASTTAALGGGVLTTRFPALARAVVRIDAAGVPEDSATPVLWAKQSGIFDREGLSVNLVPQRSGAAIAAGVAGGSYTIAKSSLVPLITAHAKGLPFVLVAPGGLSSTSNEVVDFVVKADSSLRPGSDLNGKTIAVSSLNDLYTVSIKAWVDKNGGNSSTLQFVELPIAAVAAAIEEGRVAGGGLIDPILQRALDSNQVKSIGHPFDAIAPAMMYTAWFTTRTYATSHADVVKDFADGVRSAAEYCNAHPSASDDILSKFTGVPLGVVSKMRRVTLGTTLDPALIQPMIDACAAYKVIPSSFPADEMIANAVR
jgi:NitT/TauT family transport system substrate-binding protein